ncbi:MAG: hypothetical protein KDB82_03730 [Planctomycetes bacterium]|nr:hypothetical protein [Planctomycetota bacterium]
MKTLSERQVRGYQRRAAAAPFLIYVFPPLAWAFVFALHAAVQAVADALGRELPETVFGICFFLGGLPAMFLVFFLIHKLRACPWCGASLSLPRRGFRPKRCGACDRPLTVHEYRAECRHGTVPGGQAVHRGRLPTGYDRASNAEVRKFYRGFRNARRLGLIVMAANFLVFVVAVGLGKDGLQSTDSFFRYAMAPTGGLAVVYFLYALPRGRCPHCRSLAPIGRALSPFEKSDTCPRCHGPLKPEAPEAEQKPDVPYGRLDD